MKLRCLGRPRPLTSSPTFGASAVGQDGPMIDPAERDLPDPGTKPLRFLTIGQVADELASTPSLIRGLIRRGELPAIQVGGRGQWRIERMKLEEYITAAYARANDDLRRDLADPDGTESN